MSEPFMKPAVYALLADGRTVEIRPARPTDFEAVKSMHEQMSPNNSYLRFFSLSRTAAEHEARRVTREPDLGHAALLAVYGGQVVGLASYEVERGSGGKTAEVAFAVADTMHQRGIATLLLEHLVSLARARQVEAFVAETLSENTGMLRVFSDAGLPVSTRREEGVVTITIPLPPDDDGRQFDAYLDTVAARERAASVASLRPVFQPASVAVIGASRRTGHGRPVGTREHQVRRLLGPPVRGQPERPGDRRGPLLPRCRQPAGSARPRAPGGAAGRGHRRGRRLRPPRGARARGVRGRRRRRRRGPTCSPSADSTGCG